MKVSHSLVFWLSGQLLLNLRLHLQLLPLHRYLHLHLHLQPPEKDLWAVVNILQMIAVNVPIMENLGFQKVGAMETVAG